MSAPGDATLPGADPRAKLLGVLLYTIAITLPREPGATRLLVLGALALAPLVASGAFRRGAFWRRMVPLALLASGLALLVLLTRGGPTVVRLEPLGLRVGQQGVQDATRLLARTLLPGALLVALGVTTPGPDLIAALRWMRLPEPFVSVLSTVGRTLGLIVEEGARMNRARELRSVRPRLGLALRAVGGLVGSLLGRSLARADRVHRAMLARGFDGVRLPRYRPVPLRVPHLALALAYGGLATLSALLP